MSIKVGINGFGRIGRHIFRAAMKRKEDIDFVAINDLTDAQTSAHLLKYDSVHGKYDGEIEVKDGNIVVDGKSVEVLAERDPSKLPWKSVDIAIESTGIFTNRESCMKHVEAGAKRVILTAPAKGEIDATVVLGVNDDVLNNSHQVVSNSSCTTNCVAPLIKVLNDSFGIKHGFMTTVHAYTNDQRILDLQHTDLRRARSAANSIIPTSTGAAATVGKIIPELNKKLDGISMRVPVPDGSVVDFVAELNRNVTKDEVNDAMKKASEGPMKNILEYTSDPIVSADIIGSPSSSIFDSLSTMVTDGSLVKVISWYDNEWGFSNRVVDLIKRLAQLG